ncbi:MAG: YkvI family membrane protein [Thermincolia bacterium]
MKNIQWRKALQVAATYIGTVVGAGFASGQEVMKFFTLFGVQGLLGVAIATILFIWWGTAILKLGYRLQASSHREIFHHLCGARLGHALDTAITLFLFGALCVMLAGTGALFKEYLHIPGLVGTGLTSLLVIFTLFFGLKGIIVANSFIVPLMMAMVLVLGGLSLVGQDPVALKGAMVSSSAAAAPHWLLSAVLYVAFNLVLSTAVLAPLGREIGCEKALGLGGMLGGLGLGLMAIIMVLSQIFHFAALSAYEIPMLHLVKSSLPLIQALFALVLWGEIFSTLTANLYGFAMRASQWLGRPFKVIVLGALAMAALFSKAGFANLVGTIYPLLGYLGLIYVGYLTVNTIKHLR